MLKKIRDDMKQAMRDKAKDKLVVLRSLISEIRKKEIDLRKELSDDEILETLSKAVKSRKDSIALFKKGNRPELAEKESKEVEIIEEYLPKKLSTSELTEIIENLIEKLGVSSMKGMGKVMKELKVEFGTKIDGKVASRIVRSKLN
ncbi:MAG: GatB/YqeY domain-containing protein [Candidatus Cloacimonadota bacterium]|nr:GatB/YqeY domain-containing protein [Candidatus Cloacimonadota bacterium]